MLVYDLIPPAELVGYVRGLAQEENVNRFTLSQFLPQEDVEDTEFRVTRGNLADVEAAVYRGFDTESPIARRRGGARISGSLPPISRKIRLGEEETLRLRAAQTGDTGALVRAIFADAAAMTRALLARLEMARGEVLHSGVLNLSENGVSAVIDYGRKAAHTVTAGVLWSNTATSDPIADLSNWQDTYSDTNGVLPGGILLSKTIIADLLRNANVRTLAATQAGTPGIVSRASLNNVLASYGLPQLIQYDTRVRLTPTTSTRVIPDNKLVFLPPAGEPLGAVLTGITAEALELVGSQYLTTRQAAGITGVIDKTSDPVATWTKSAALALPILANPDLTLTATVR